MAVMVSGSVVAPAVAVPFQAQQEFNASAKGRRWACMRKLVMLCYGVLKNRAPFDPDWASKKAP